MVRTQTYIKKIWMLFILLFCFGLAQAATRQMEYLDRGVVAVKVNNGVYLSWRYLGTDQPAIGFNVYRDGALLNNTPITKSTNYTDEGGSAASIYVIKSVINGIEQETSKSTSVWSKHYKSLQLRRPTGNGCTYTPNDISAGDVDGDGEYELIVKWDPSNAQDNSNSGYTGNVYLDCYKLDGTFLWQIDLGLNIRAGAHYTQFQIYDYDEDGKAEVACKTAPGTKDGKGDYVLLGSDNPTADYRNSGGYILSGPEYLTIFRGATGEEINTIPFNPLRGSVTKANWGDDYGNRVDRFLACTAYLDGVHPSLVMCRGYYTQSNLVAYDFKDNQLVQRWEHHSTTSNVGAYGEGYHNLSVADVDFDGFDEIIYGSACIDHDGKLYYRKGFGHGDAMHVSQMDPSNDDLEGWFIHEDKNSSYGFELRNLRTGDVIFGENTGTDVGRGLAADIDARYRGFECWSGANNNVYDSKGQVISIKKPSVNFRVYWDGDLQDELLDGSIIDKWNGNRTTNLVDLYNEDYGSSCNGTKKTPCLSADLLGDWREEIILYNGNDPSKINIYTTTIPTEHRLFTPMHDAIYRMGIAWQNTAYNQPPHLGFYIGDGVDNIIQPNIYVIKNGSLVIGEPTLTKEGAGSSKQTVGNDSPIEDFSYSWTNASSVKVNWEPQTPEGIQVMIDNDSKKVHFSGIAAVIGEYEFTVTTISDANEEASLSGVITVIDSKLLSELTYTGELTQTVFEGNAITDLVFTWGKGTSDVEISGLPTEMMAIKRDNSVTFSGTPTESFTATVSAVGNGDPINYEINITVIPASIKKVAYITDSTAINYGNDTKLLPALKADEKLYITQIEALQSNVDLSAYDLVVISEVPGSTSPIMAQLKGIDKPVLNLKVHIYKVSDGTWGWATTGFGDNYTETTLSVASNMLEHPMFKGINFSNGNEVQMFSSVSSKGLTYMNPENFTSQTGDIQTIASVKGETQTCIFEAPVGTIILGTTLSKPFIQIGLNSSSYANFTDDGIAVVKNACYYLLGINEEDTSNDVIKASQWAVNPNPIGEVINISTFINDDNTLDIRIYNACGKIVLSQKITVQEGDNEIKINRGCLAPGSYILELENNGMIRSKIILLK